MQSPHCTVSKFLPAQLSRNCRLTNNLLDKITSTPLSSVYPTDQLPQFLVFWVVVVVFLFVFFLTFFVNYVRQIRYSIDRQVVHIPSQRPREWRFSVTPLCAFETVTQETVLKCMKQMYPKTCVLDPIPTSLLFECSDQVVSLLTTIVNQSLSTGIFPSCMKSAAVKPLCWGETQKPSLDPNVLKNSRPVSDLPFVSKLIEKLVLDQLVRHLDHTNLWHSFQSAYRPKHSTETSLLRVLNDLLTASDSGCISFLTILDLRAAFDTIVFSILLTRFESTFGIRDLALSSVPTCKTGHK